MRKCISWRAPSEELYQPALRVSVVRLKSFSLPIYRALNEDSCSNCEDMPAEPSLCWSHMSSIIFSNVTAQLDRFDFKMFKPCSVLFLRC